MKVKQDNKVDLTRIIKRELRESLCILCLFDVQIKRFHEYKRQHLNLLHISPFTVVSCKIPRSSYHSARFYLRGQSCTRLRDCQVHHQSYQCRGKHINNDKRIEDRLKVVFLPNYRVSLAQRIVPAADLSEQISTAGKEASGTGNMKLAVNGALTIGTSTAPTLKLAKKSVRKISSSSDIPSKRSQF